MSNKNSDIGYDQIPSLLQFYFDERLKALNTSMPGIVQDYNEKTRRATVLPALKTVLTDGQSVSKPILANVPVLHPQAGGFIVHLPIQKGDAVMLLFSQRDMDSFKRTLDESTPAEDGFMSLKDAVAIPGYGKKMETVSIGDRNALSIQSADGGTLIEIRSGAIMIEANTITLNGAVKITDGGSLVHGTTKIDKDHVHPEPTSRQWKQSIKMETGKPKP